MTTITNVGNVVGILRKETPPDKTYILWARVLNPANPDIVQIYYYDGDLEAWTPLTAPSWWLAPVLSTENDPPVAAQTGDRHIIGTSPTGVFVGNQNKIAIKTDGGWDFVAPVAGAVVLARLENRLYQYEATGWEVITGVDFGTLEGAPDDNTALAAALDAHKDEAVATLRGNVDPAYDDLEKMLALVNLISTQGLKIPSPFDASTETTFPTGTDGNESFIVTAPGTVQTIQLQAGDFIFTNIENATADPADWFVVQRNVDEATDAVIGLVRLATLAEAENNTGTGVITASSLLLWAAAYLGDNTEFDTIFDDDADALAPAKQLELIARKVRLRVKALEDNKVDKDGSKVLSDENFTTALKDKLDGLPASIINQASFYVNSDLDTVSHWIGFEGAIDNLSQILPSEIASVAYEASLDAVVSWDDIADLTALATWISTNVTTGTTKWRLRVIVTYNSGSSGEVSIGLKYTI